MGQRQNYLRSIIEKRFGRQAHPKLTIEEALNHRESIYEIYSALKGQFNEIPVKFGPWDISTKDFIIELDEERHFNRFRLLTLQSDIYKNHTLFSLSDYKKYCVTYENACLRAASWGSNWKNSSTERMFAKSAEEGCLDGNGSSRWKQRAYYDFLKDVTSKMRKLPVIRISVYDIHKGLTVDMILSSENDKFTNELIDTKIAKHCG